MTVQKIDDHHNHKRYCFESFQFLRTVVFGNSQLAKANPFMVNLMSVCNGLANLRWLSNVDLDKTGL